MGTLRHNMLGLVLMILSLKGNILTLDDSFYSIEASWIRLGCCCLFRVVGLSVISLLFSSTVHPSFEARRGDSVLTSEVRHRSPLLTYYCQTVAMTLKNNEHGNLPERGYDSSDFPFQETGADKSSLWSQTLFSWRQGCPQLCPVWLRTR